MTEESRDAWMGERRPCLDGAESGNPVGMAAGELAEHLMKFDVVSLDVFDTAVFRPFSSPVDLFMVLGERLSFLNFSQIRVNMERRARKIRKEAAGDTEADLGEIYACVERETRIPKEVGMEAEIAAEADFAFANPYIHEVYRLLKGAGKTVVFTSDMYLGEAAIRRILETCGYDGGEPLFVSCEYRVAKSGGGLFRRVRSEMGETLSYVHVGDNAASDVRSAVEQGFAAVHYGNVNSEGTPFRVPGMSELTGSLYRGIVNAHLHNGSCRYSVPYEHGFLYGGLYVLGFVHWIKEYCELRGITKVLFLSRDGEIYRRVFRLLGGHTESSYVYWSRLPTICLEAVRDRHNFLRRGIRERRADVRPMTVAENLRMLCLDPLAEQLPKYSLKPEAKVSEPGNIGRLERLVTDCWDDVLGIYEKQERAARAYLEACIGGHRKIAVVDTGWYGSGPLSVKWLAEERWKLGVEVDCLLAGSNASPDVTLPVVMHGRIHAYLFDWSRNREHAAFHARRNPGCNNTFFELFTQAPHPTLEGFSWEDGRMSFRFGFAGVENYETVREIHRGIGDFARHYLQAARREPWLLRVEGRDAYLPFRFIASFPEYFQRFFGGWKLKRTVGENAALEDLETLESMMERCGVSVPGVRRMELTKREGREPLLHGIEDEEGASREELVMELRALRGILAATEERLSRSLRRQEAYERRLAETEKRLGEGNG